MSKVRINFYLPTKVYLEVQEIAKEEATTSAEIFRNAVKLYIKKHSTNKLDQQQQEGDENGQE